MERRAGRWMQRAQVEDMSEKDVAREIKRLEKLMLEHARNLEFEQAAVCATSWRCSSSRPLVRPRADRQCLIEAHLGGGGLTRGPPGNQFVTDGLLT
jgi:hypothetical protein